MWPLFSVVSRILSPGEGGAKDRRQALAQILRQQFNPEHHALQRDEKHAIHVERSVSGESESVATGATSSQSEDPVRWVEFVWAAERTIGDCRWSDVHWRFYRDGRIAFHAKMQNVGRKLDTGDIQGHRIELRTRDGLLIGAWAAAFFVRNRGAVSHFPATLMDDHPLLTMHFDELAEHQRGHWFYEG